MRIRPTRTSRSRRPEGAPAASTGRRADLGARRRFSVLTVATLGIPLLTVGALALVRPADLDEGARAPQPVALDRSDVVCPSASGDAATFRAGDADGGSGEVTLRVDGESSTLRLRGTTDSRERGAASVRASGRLAPGLVGVRAGGRTGTPCQRPEPEQWFVGVGAAPEHASVLEFVNPDSGPAVADVFVHGPDGPVEAPRLRGITVPGNSSTTVALDKVLPTRDELALRVSVGRGRLGVFVRDEVDELGRGADTADWLAPQRVPSTALQLPALGRRGGDRTLVVANPSDNEARVQVKLATEESEFVPSGADELRVPPGAVRTVDLGGLLGDKTAKDALSVVLAANEPVLGTLRTLEGEDLTHSVGAEPVEERAATLLPDGEVELVVSGVTTGGSLRWTALSADGSEVGSDSVDLVPGHAVSLALPRRARLLDVRLEGAVASLAVTGRGAGRTTWPLSPLQVSALVPDVRPAHSSSR